MLKQTIHLVLAILLIFGIQCYCSTTAASSQTSEQSSTTTVPPYNSVSTSNESTKNGNNASSSEHSTSTVSTELFSTNQSTSTVSTSTKTVITKVTTGSPPSTEISTSSAILSTNSSSSTLGAVKNVTTYGTNESSTNTPSNTINIIATEGTTITSEKSTTSQPTITTTTTKKTTKGTTGTTNNIDGPSKNKGEPMSLEEKQRRNGIVSASICVGSLVLIGIAYLSSFVDKPSEKVPKFPKNKYNREETNYKSQTKPAGTKKISFDNGFSIQETPTTSSHQPNLKSPVKTDQIESPIKTDQIELNSVENNDKNIQNENRRRTGWDVLSKDPAYFDNYQPKNTTTQAEVNEM